MKFSDIVTTQDQADNRPKNTSSSPKNDAIPVDDKNEVPSCKATIEKWGGDKTNESEPFRNLNLKKLIQAMIKEATPSDFDDILRTLPDYEDARNQGREYFDDSNVTFWNAVKNWERKLNGA